MSSITIGMDSLTQIDSRCDLGGDLSGPTQLYCGQGQQGPKYEQLCYTYSGGIVRNLGWPYPRKRKGYGVSVLELPLAVRGLASDNTTGKSKGGSQQGFNPILAKEVRKVIFDNSFPLPSIVPYYSTVESLIVAYELIKSIPGNMTPGVGKTTLDGIDLNWFNRISAALSAGKYRFGSIRKVMIPKANSSELRPLGIASPRDKVVQKSLQLALAAVFEPLFLTTSHGFRPNRSCHSALNQVRMQFNHSTWVIDADIRKCFDRINHDVLMNIISRRISCKLTLHLIKSALSAGYLDQVGGNFIANSLGTPQGNVLSPLLCNIYLHEFDVFMNELIENFNRGDFLRSSPTYRKLCREMAKLPPGSREWRQLRSEVRDIPSVDLMDTNFRRLRYVRYADDFIIGVIGSHADAISILNLVNGWLMENLKLELHPDKTSVVRLRSESFKFLGVIIGPTESSDKRTVRPAGDGTSARKRVQARLSMRIDILDMFRRLKAKGFCYFSRSLNIHKGQALGAIQNLDIVDIIRYYNSVFRGIWNYFSFVDNCASLVKVWWVLCESLAYTLARKLRIRGIKKVFKKFGNPITEQGVSFWRPDSFARDADRLINNLRSSGGFFLSFHEVLNLISRTWARKYTRSNIGHFCIICGSNHFVQMHHVRMVRGLRARKLDFFTEQMAAINRKQVPLCRDHHALLHKNALSELDRSRFITGCQEFFRETGTNGPKR